MRRLHTADRRSRRALKTTAGVLAGLTGHKITIVALGHHLDNFVGHKLLVAARAAPFVLARRGARQQATDFTTLKAQLHRDSSQPDS